MATIVLTGGGSAGHCTPHLALLPYLKNDFEKIYYIGSKNGIEKEIIEKQGIPYYSIPCAKLVRSLSAKNLTMPFKVIAGINEAGKILDLLSPDVVFSKGGYVALPVVFAASKRNIPIIAHESDYTVGLANKLSANKTKKVFTSFPSTARALKNGEYIGSPIRNLLKNTNKTDALKFFKFSGEKPILLVMGGSLGAEKINKVFRYSLDNILPKFDVIHICGKGGIDKNINKKGYYQAEYLHNIEYALTIASVCVTRAGSNALFELLSLKKPCVVIPLPKGTSRGDQVLNASYFQKEGVISVLPQNDLTANSLTNYIYAVYANRFYIERTLSIKPVEDKSREISRRLADYAR